MLLGHNIVADREAEAGAFASRFGGEERLKELVLDLGRNWASTDSLPRILAKVSSSKRQRTLSLRGGDCSSCP